MAPVSEHRVRPIRTFTPRWRNSPLTDERMATLLPRYGLPEGLLTADAARPLIVEIGSGHGAAAIAYAQTHPDAAVVALEVHVPGVARMMAAAERNGGVPNLQVFVGDALPFLRERVAPASVSAFHLFFPDPWPKARHAKRRFVQPDTLDLLGELLIAQGHLLVATDQDFYAEHVRSVVAARGGWSITEGERPAWRPDDGFEAKGLRAGRRISELRLTRGE